MLFEVWYAGRRMMWTKDVMCVPRVEDLRALMAAGYVLRLDGRRMKKEELRQK